MAKEKRSQISKPDDFIKPASIKKAESVHFLGEEIELPRKGTEIGGVIKRFFDKVNPIIESGKNSSEFFLNSIKEKIEKGDNLAEEYKGVGDAITQADKSIDQQFKRFFNALHGVLSTTKDTADWNGAKKEITAMGDMLVTYLPDMKEFEKKLDELENISATIPPQKPKTPETEPVAATKPLAEVSVVESPQEPAPVPPSTPEKVSEQSPDVQGKVLPGGKEELRIEPLDREAQLFQKKVAAIKPKVEESQGYQVLANELSELFREQKQNKLNGNLDSSLANEIAKKITELNEMIIEVVGQESPKTGAGKNKAITIAIWDELKPLIKDRGEREALKQFDEERENKNKERKSKREEEKSAEAAKITNFVEAVLDPVHEKLIHYARQGKLNAENRKKFDDLHKEIEKYLLQFKGNYLPPQREREARERILVSFKNRADELLGSIEAEMAKADERKEETLEASKRVELADEEIFGEMEKNSEFFPIQNELRSFYEIYHYDNTTGKIIDPECIENIKKYEGEMKEYIKFFVAKKFKNITEEENNVKISAIFGKLIENLKKEGEQLANNQIQSEKQKDEANKDKAAGQPVTASRPVQPGKKEEEDKLITEMQAKEIDGKVLRQELTLDLVKEREKEIKANPPMPKSPADLTIDLRKEIGEEENETFAPSGNNEDEERERVIESAGQHNQPAQSEDKTGKIADEISREKAEGKLVPGMLKNITDKEIGQSLEEAEKEARAKSTASRQEIPKTGEISIDETGIKNYKNEGEEEIIELTDVAEESPRFRPSGPKGPEVGDLTAVQPVEAPIAKKASEKIKTTEELFSEKFDIKAEELEKIEGFNKLSDGQKRLAFENLEQLTLGRIQEEARKGHGENMAKSSMLGRIWQGFTKKYQIADIEKAKAGEIMAGGMAKHGTVLKQLVDGLIKFGPATEVINGKLEIKYATGFPEKDKDAVDRFNQAATEYSKIPYEWSLGTAGKEEREKYQAAKIKYKKERGEIINIKFAESKGKDEVEKEREAALYMNEIDSKLKLNQFFNAHPEVEKELENIKDKSAWSRSYKNIFNQHGVYMAAGFIGRSVSMGVIGFAGAPIVAAVVGGIRARNRAKETLRDNERDTRHGQGRAEEEIRLAGVEKEITDLKVKIRQATDKKEKKILQTSLGEKEAELKPPLTPAQKLNLEINKQYNEAIAKFKTEKKKEPTKEEKDTILGQLAEKTRKNYETAGVKFTKAEEITEKIKNLVRLQDEAEFADQGKGKRKMEPNDKNALAKSLMLALDLAEDRRNKGLIDFGTTDERPKNWIDLTQTICLGRAKIEEKKIEELFAATKAEKKIDIAARFDKAVTERDQKKTKAGKDYLFKQTLAGAGLGASFAAAGSFFREGVGMAFGVRGSDKGIINAIKTGKMENLYAGKGILAAVRSGNFEKAYKETFKPIYEFMGADKTSAAERVVEVRPGFDYKIDEKGIPALESNESLVAPQSGSIPDPESEDSGVISKTVEIESGSNIERKLIAELEKNNVSKAEAGVLAHKMVTDYAESQGENWEKYNLIKPGTKVNISYDDEGGWQVENIDEKGVIARPDSDGKDSVDDAIDKIRGKKLTDLEKKVNELELKQRSNEIYDELTKQTRNARNNVIAEYINEKYKVDLRDEDDKNLAEMMERAKDKLGIDPYKAGVAGADHEMEKFQFLQRHQDWPNNRLKEVFNEYDRPHNDRPLSGIWGDKDKLWEVEDYLSEKGAVIKPSKIIEEDIGDLPRTRANAIEKPPVGSDESYLDSDTDTGSNQPGPVTEDLNDKSESNMAETIKGVTPEKTKSIEQIIKSGGSNWGRAEKFLESLEQKKITEEDVVDYIISKQKRVEGNEAGRQKLVSALRKIVVELKNTEKSIDATHRRTQAAINLKRFFDVK